MPRPAAAKGGKNVIIRKMPQLKTIGALFLRNEGVYLLQKVVSCSLWA